MNKKIHWQEVCFWAFALLTVSTAMPCSGKTRATSVKFPCGAPSLDAQLTSQLSNNDVRGAIKTANAIYPAAQAYEQIAAYQIDRKQFDAARATIRRISIGTPETPKEGLVARCQALTVLAAGLQNAGRKVAAQHVLDLALEDAKNIPNIYYFTGSVPYDYRAAERLVDIAEVQQKLGHYAQAVNSIDIAESDAQSSTQGVTALKLIEAFRKASGDKVGTVRANREVRLADAGAYGYQNRDRWDGARMLVYGEDGDVADILGYVKGVTPDNYAVTLLCGAARVMNGAKIDVGLRNQLLDAARARLAGIIDVAEKQKFNQLITDAASGAINK